MTKALISSTSTFLAQRIDLSRKWASGKVGPSWVLGDLPNEGSQGCWLQLHMSRDGKGVVQWQVPAMSNIQKPVCKVNTVCIRPVYPHVLSEMQDLDIFP